jgi:Tol biopolymer transport system component
MPLSTGHKLGPYEIVSSLGAGGMGEVYRGRDTRLSRDVAIKVLPAAFANDVQYMARFEREAQLLAALNHPNIATVYGIEQGALVMELVEGEELHGPLGLEEALAIARQIALGLEAAHDRGIVHRDLKPANIKITPGGVVKILDFGLAKTAGELPAGAAGSATVSPTLSLAMTQAGTILGTAAYMSPEQARGKPVDKRADIWAFGAVFYEMLTGKRLFEGEDLTETLASVVKDRPDLSAAPAQVRRLLERCLEKDPKKRLRDIGDVWDLLQDAPAPAAAAGQGTGRRRAWVWPAAAGLFAVLAGAVSFVHFREQPPKPEVTRFAVPAPEKSIFIGTPPAISPDGRTLAFAASIPDGRTQIWLKPMNSLEARVLPGTDGVGAPIFWSPDGRSLAYSGPRLSGLMRIELAGGPPQTLECPQVAFTSAPLGDWSSAGTIVFHVAEGLMQVPAGGGTCSLVTRVDPKRGELRHSAPSFLPDGRHFLYLRLGKEEHDSGVYVGSLDSKPEAQSTSPILKGASSARYVAAPGSSHGYVMFLRGNTLMAQRFDAGAFSVVGDAVPIAERVSDGANADNGMFTASGNGTLIYHTGEIGGNRQLTWYDRSGKSLGQVGGPGNYVSLSLSPDGKRAAIDRLDNAQNNYDVWIHDLAPGTTNRFTFDPAPDYSPVWSPDGSRIVWSAQRGGTYSLYRKASDFSGEETALPQPKSTAPIYPDDWSRDGRFLLYTAVGAAGDTDLWLLPLQGEAKPVLFLGSRFNESQGRFSPDGRYVAYVSNESGKGEVYVRSITPDGKPGGQQMISQGGGQQPLWRRDAKELFYLWGSKVMAVPVTTAPTFQRTGAPVALFTGPIYQGGSGTLRRWDVTPDGQKFLMVTALTEVVSEPIMVVLNWTGLLRK